MATVADIFEAIGDRWDDQSLGDAIPGGIYKDQASKDATMPYVVASLVASPQVEITATDGDSANEYTLTTVQLSLHSRGGTAAGGALVQAIRDAFEYAPLSISGGELVTARIVSVAHIDDPDQPNALLWALTYEILWSQSVTLRPS